MINQPKDPKPEGFHLEPCSICGAKVKVEFVEGSAGPHHSGITTALCVNEANHPKPSDSQDELEDLFDGIRQTCGDCEHPRCLSIVKSAKSVVQANYLPKTEVEAAIASELKFYAPNSHASRAVKSIAHTLGLHKK